METLNNLVIGTVILIVIFLLSMVPYAMGRNTGYREGQIDALNGKIYYQLERQENNSFIWVECPAACEGEKKADEGD